jgi:hypothetical protein
VVWTNFIEFERTRFLMLFRYVWVFANEVAAPKSFVPKFETTWVVPRVAARAVCLAKLAAEVAP